jgi:hypothetical protein
MSHQIAPGDERLIGGNQRLDQRRAGERLDRRGGRTARFQQVPRRRRAVPAGCLREGRAGFAESDQG